METKTKMILTAIGLAAIIVPAVLLVVFSSNKPKAADVTIPAGNRQINQGAIQKEVPTNIPAVASPVPTPSPKLPTSPTPKATPSPIQGSTSSSGLN